MMPNMKEHMIIGFVAGAGIYAAVKYLNNEPIDPGRAICWGAVGSAVAVLPDVIEPAISPSHRAFAHSAVAGGLAVYGVQKTLENDGLTDEEKAAATATMAAFLTHIVADSCTPAGIPLI